MAIVAATNYTAAGTAFRIAGLDSDAYEFEQVGTLGKAMDEHDHSATRGLAVARLANGITIASPVLASPVINGNLLPTAGDTYNIGSAAFKWQDVIANGTITTLGVVVPGTGAGTPAQHGLYRSNVVKAWARVNSAGTLIAGFNITSSARDAVGSYTVTFDRDFANTNYAVTVTPAQVEKRMCATAMNLAGAGSVGIAFWDNANVAADTTFALIAIGDQ